MKARSFAALCLVLPAAAWGALSAGCSSAVPIGVFVTDGGGTDAGTTTDSAFDVSLPTDGASPINGCTTGSTDIVVLGFSLSAPVLYRFDAVAATFKPMPAPTGCPTGTGFAGKNPWAAALDRSAVLWTHYLEWDNGTKAFTYDHVYTIDTSTSACTDTGKTMKLVSGKVIEYGLAFLPNEKDPNKDDLFASALTPPGLSNAELLKFDGALSATSVGPLSGTAHSFLTATGDGRLYTLYQAGNPVWGIRQLDPATGKTISEQPVTGLTSSQGPFVFWGGSLYAFWNKVYSPQSLLTEVYKIDLKTWTATVIASGSFVVTAAAVSTCAPLLPPK